MHSCGSAIWITTFVTRETVCSAVKLNVLLGDDGEACFKIDA